MASQKSKEEPSPQSVALLTIVALQLQKREAERQALQEHKQGSDTVVCSPDAVHPSAAPAACFSYTGTPRADGI